MPQVVNRTGDGGGKGGGKPAAGAKRGQAAAQKNEKARIVGLTAVIVVALGFMGWYWFASANATTTTSSAPAQAMTGVEPSGMGQIPTLPGANGSLPSTSGTLPDGSMGGQASQDPVDGKDGPPESAGGIN